MNNVTNTIPYLSPSSFRLKESDPEAFYVEYLSGMPRSGRTQTLAMALGSAFDARVKEKLYKEFVSDQKAEYTFEAMFEKSGSPDPNVTRADSLMLFEKYLKCGAFADLVLELNQGLKGSLNFEFKLTTEMKEISIEASNLPPLRLSGWPDLMFSIFSEGTVYRVIYDWKVNGYYSAANKSPLMYYSKARYVNKLPEAHKGFKSFRLNSNAGSYLLLHDGPCPEANWRDQLTIYSWMAGNSIEETNIHGIEQVTGNGDKLRFTSARFLDTDVEYRKNLLARLRSAWADCHDGHFFKELSLEDSQRKCELLDKRARLPDKGMDWQEIGNTDALMEKLNDNRKG